MRQLVFGLAALASFLAMSPPADSQEATSPLAKNAALQYWQAFSQLPTVEKEHEALFDNPTAAALQEPSSVKLLDGARQSLIYLDRGSAMPQCDWGLDYGDGVGLLLPHLAKSRDLARLAALDARRAFERDDYKTARNRLQGILMIGRHVSRDPVLINLLVGFALEGMAIDAASPYMPYWKLPHAEAVNLFEKLPRRGTYQESIALEKKHMALWIIAKLEDEDQRSSLTWKELWKSLFNGTSQEAPQVESAQAAAQMVRDLLPVYDELNRFAALPREQFVAQYPTFKQRAKADSALAGLLLPSLDTVRDKSDRHEARLAMLLAAAAYVEGGQSKLNSIKDPYGSGPFEYRALDKGFELKSRLTFEGKPVTLAIGQRK